jgi:hypothetical protein
MSKGLVRVLMAGLVGLLLVPQARAVSLALTPVNSVAAVGDTVAIAIEIAGLGVGTPPTLSSFDLDVGFDPSVLGFQSASFGTALGTGADVLTSAGLLGPNSIDVAAASLLSSATLDAAQPASFVLATLFFKALAPGVSPLAIADAILADTSSVPGGNQIFVDALGAASVTVAPVPEPAALLVFGAGVLLVRGAPGYRRKR